MIYKVQYLIQIPNITITKLTYTFILTSEFNPDSRIYVY